MGQIVRSNFRKAVVSRPELYLEASFEVFLFMVACTWFITCVWNPDVLLASKGGNRINDIFAYNNVCVGFDTAPARYIAQPLFALQSFLGVRFGNLDLLRLNLEWIAGRVTNTQFYCSATMDILFMATMLLRPQLPLLRVCHLRRDHVPHDPRAVQHGAETQGSAHLQDLGWCVRRLDPLAAAHRLCRLQLVRLRALPIGRGETVLR